MTSAFAFRIACPPVLGLALLAGAPAAAQDTTSREVVQPLPSQTTARLNNALTRLARNPQSVDALIEAGEASAEVGDLDAAIGFYGRAQDVAPNNWRVSLGMARVFLRAGRPADALPLFDLAQTSGADSKQWLGDRGLAFDMTGDNGAAQAAYQRALSLDAGDAEARRRLAISYAISGNRKAFDDTLRPLLDRRDFASFRAHAFGLAILGEQKQASAIVDAVMPRDLAARINPYLGYMPRLTKAQQAGAANLGVFPKAADIGRDEPRLASAAAPVRMADSRLQPSGEPLGRAPAQAAQQPRPAVQPAPRPVTQPPPPPPATQAAQPAPARRPASVADAFADIGTAKTAAAPRSADAVDIASINVRRESSAPPEPKKPDHPSRIWVQVATGKDIDALKFDWRKFARKAPDLLGKLKPHTAPWGESTRLLAGPLPTREDASELIDALKDEGIDTFRFTSPEGAEITELK